MDKDVIGVHGKVTPRFNLVGREYRFPPITLHMLDAERYVVLDGVPDTFDVETAVADLMGDVLPKAVSGIGGNDGTDTGGFGSSDV